MYGDKCVGAIVCKLDMHKKTVRRGYIAMLAVDENYRKEKIGNFLILPKNYTSPISFVLMPRFEFGHESDCCDGERWS